MFIGDFISIAIILLFPVESSWIDGDSSLFHATATLYAPFPSRKVKIWDFFKCITTYNTHIHIWQC